MSDTTLSVIDRDAIMEELLTSMIDTYLNMAFKDQYSLRENLRKVYVEGSEECWGRMTDEELAQRYYDEFSEWPHGWMV